MRNYLNQLDFFNVANEFRCSECSKLLPTERLLREHVRYHRLVYTCSHCPIDEEGRGRSFPNTHSLATHISYCHSQSRPFPCPETDCNYSAKSQTDLTKHLEVHANTLWYCCEVCVVFSIKSTQNPREFYLKSVTLTNWFPFSGQWLRVHRT